MLNEANFTGGPFGDHTGFYSLEGQYPVFHVTCVTHRKDPLYLTTVVGPPPQEDYFIGHAIERIFLPVMKMQYPEIVDVAMPAEGIFQNLDDRVHPEIVSRAGAKGDERDLVAGAGDVYEGGFGGGPRRRTCRIPSEVVWKALCAIDPERDIQFVLGPVTLDHAARLQDNGIKDGNRRNTKMA